MRWTIVLVAVVLLVGSEGRKHHKHGNKHDKKQSDHVKHGEMTGQDQLVKPEGTGVHWKKHKPVDASADTKAKQQWIRLTHYHKSDDDACESMICKKHHVCMVDAATGAASCVHKRQIRQRNHRSKHHKKSEKKEHIDQKKLKKMKEQAHAFKAKYDKTVKKKHGHMKTAFDYMDTKAHKKAALKAVDHNMLLEKTKVCTSKELEGMGRRLLDWFHLLMTQPKHKGKGHKKHDRHHKQKRNSKKKDLRDDACTCQSSVSWEFDQLDRDVDEQLSAAELDDIENNGYEHCVKPFFDGCDHDNNKLLSHQEWCCCFADVLPPCLAAQRKVADTEEDGVAKIMPGRYIPHCDKHGYYRPVQCHSSTGFCWCADRNGQEVYGTRTRSAASLQCEKHVPRRRLHRKTREGGKM